MVELLDHIIIGGGLSGLYLAYKLLSYNKKLKILIIEKKGLLGGKINTLQIPKTNIKIEAGNDRFSPELHPLLIELIKEANLLSKLSRYTNDISFILADKYYQNVEDEGFPFNTDGYNNANELISEAYDIFLRTNSEDDLYKISTTYLLERVTTYDQLKFIKTTYPYWSYLYLTNAAEGKKHLSDMDLQGDYYKLKDGMSQIKKFLVNKLKLLGCHFRTNSKIRLINESKNISEVEVELKNNNKNNIKKYYCKNLVLAIPPSSIKKLNCLNFRNQIINNLNSFVSVPTCKVFMAFPKVNGKVWFKGLSPIVTSNPINYIIPISEKNGTIMVSYTEGQMTIPIFEASLESRLVKYILRQLSKLFPNKNIPTPFYHNIFYNEEGHQVFPPGVEGNIVRETIIKTTDLPIYIIGDSYSNNQGWLEGSLESALKAFLVINQNVEVVPEAITQDREEDFDEISKIQLVYNQDEVISPNDNKIYQDENLNIKTRKPHKSRKPNKLKRNNKTNRTNRPNRPNRPNMPNRRNRPNKPNKTNQPNKLNKSNNLDNLSKIRNNLEKEQFSDKREDNSNKGNYDTQVVTMEINKPEPVKIIPKTIPSNLPSISLDELSKHNLNNNAWVSINGYIYDITQWVGLHPVCNLLLPGIGKDYTNEFSKLKFNTEQLVWLRNELETILVASLKNE